MANIFEDAALNNKYSNETIELLPTVPYNVKGLLTELPKIESDKKGWPYTEELNPSIYSFKSSWPKLTIITPSYNQGAFIEQTIRSVLLQNYPNVEYIILDGGSTDQTIDILRKYAPWISYWKSEKDGGQGAAINKGFKMASGDFYAWINSDDYYLPSTLLKVITTFNNKKVDFVYGYSYNFNTKTNTFSTLNKTAPILDYFLRFCTIAQPACFWNANIHKPIWEELHCSLDYELWLRLVKGKSRKLIRQPLAVANVHINAKTHSSGMDSHWKSDHELICSIDAHGPVANWKLKSTLFRIYTRFSKLMAGTHISKFIK